MTIAALESVFTETISLFHKLTKAAADIHGKGESAVKEMIRKERELVSKVPIPVSVEELENTAQTLRAIKT